MTIEDVRARLESQSWGISGGADLRALLDDHARLAGEVDRLTAEADCVAVPEDGVPRERWLRVGPHGVAALRAEVVRLTRERDEAVEALRLLRNEALAGLDAGQLRRLREANERARKAEAERDSDLREYREAANRGAAEHNAAMAHALAASSAATEQAIALGRRVDDLLTDRDHLTAALAEVREAAREYLDARAEAAQCAHAYADGWGPGPARIADAAGVEREAFAHLGAIVLATPADLAATRDARMMEAGRASMQSAINEGFDARDARVRAEAREEIAVTAERYWAGGEEIARWIRAGNEADRIERGGR